MLTIERWFKVVGLNFKLDARSFPVRSAGRPLFVIGQKFVIATAFTRVRDFVASAFAPRATFAGATA